MTRAPSADKKLPKAFQNTLDRVREKNEIKPTHTENPAESTPTENTARPTEAKIIPQPVFDITHNEAELKFIELLKISDAEGMQSFKEVERRTNRYVGHDVSCLLTTRVDSKGVSQPELRISVGRTFVDRRDLELLFSIRPYDRTNKLYSQKGRSLLEDKVQFGAVADLGYAESWRRLVSEGTTDDSLASQIELTDIKIEDGVLTAKISFKNLSGSLTLEKQRQERMGFASIEGTISCTLEDMTGSPDTHQTRRRRDRGWKAREEEKAAAKKKAEEAADASKRAHSLDFYSP